MLFYTRNTDVSKCVTLMLIKCFLCFLGNIVSNATSIKLPTNQATIATEVTGLEINSGDILSPSLCSWQYDPGLPTGFQFYSSSFSGCASSTTPTYTVSCSESSGVVSSNLTFLTPLTSNVNISIICLPSPTYNLQVTVKDCTSPTPSNVPINPPTGVYNTPAHFQCSQNSTLFYSSGTIGNTATKCLASAEWENETIVQCWSAPTATLIGNNTHCVDDKATFKCNAVGGFPLADRVEVYFNGQIQALNGNTWTSTALISSNNGDIVECRAISNYTIISDYSHLGRDNNTLIIYYAAKNPKIENQISDLLIKADNGYLLRSDGTLTMNCSADGNPAVYCSWLCSSCVRLSNTCEVTNVGVSSSTDITCMVGNGVCGGGTVNINQRITLVPEKRIPTLIVDGSPTTASVITRNKTQSLSLGCGIESQTEMKTTFLWVKDGEVKSGSNNLTIDNLASSDTGLYSCNTTDAFGNFSSTIYIDVIFGAENFTVDGDPNSNKCTWYIATPGPQSCNISFSLNPATYTTNLTKNGAIIMNDANQMQTSPPTFVFLRNKPTYSDNGVYKLGIKNDKFQVDFNFIISIINMTAPTPQPITNPTYTGISTPNNPITNPPFIPLQNNLGVIIGAACGGVVLLILIVVLVYCFVRKQRNKTPKSATSHDERGENGGNNLYDREEVDNPLYATSGLNNAQGSGHDNPSFINGAEKSGKEEKVNPLYVPSDQPDQIEGAYAEVDKKKKYGKETSIKEEKVNPLYAPSDQPDQIQSAYAEVRKKKSGKKPEKEEKVNPLYVSSDQPFKVDDAYAEVDKKKKRK